MMDYPEGQDPRPMTPRQRLLPNAPVQLAEDEVYVRKYETVQAGGGSGGKGTLYVTNARVIFYASAKGRGTQRESQLLQQTRLRDITGVAAYVSYRLSLGLVVVTSVFGLGLLAALITKNVLWIILDAIVVGVCLLMLFGGGSKHGGAGVIIHSAATETSPINFGSFAARRGGFIHTVLAPFSALFRAYTAFDVAFGAPGPDTDALIAELGALILDMQQRGGTDETVARWRPQEGGPSGRGIG